MSLTEKTSFSHTVLFLSLKSISEVLLTATKLTFLTSSDFFPLPVTGVAGF